MPPQGGRLRAHRRRACRPACGCMPRRRSRAARPAGPGRQRPCWRAAPTRWPAGVHEARSSDALRRHRLPHQPLRLHRRGRLRDFLHGDAGARDLARAAAVRAERASRSGSARATRCGSKRAFASTATTSTRRPARSRPALAWSIQKRRRDGRRISRAPSASSASSPTGPARARVGIKPEGRAPAREGTEILSLHGRADRQGHVRRLRAERQRAGRDGLRRRPDSPRPARR